MSVLIIGMDRPNGCANCNFVGSPIYDSKGRAIYSCNVPVDGISGKNVTEQVIDMYEGGGGDYFPDWCPLVDLGKHGRLIDEDDVINAIHERLHELQTHKEFIKKRGDIDLLGILPYIAKIQAVIEAEDGT